MSSLSLSTPVQCAAQVMAILQAARFEMMELVGGKSLSSPAYKQAILLSRMFERANDAIKDDFTQITMGESPRYDVILRDKKTGGLIDPGTGAPL